MRIPHFEVRSQRSIQLAQWEKVPRLMIIAGPNGAGKSTLLNALRGVNGTQHIMYVGPHRSSRRQTVQQRHLLTTTISIEDLLSRTDNPGFEGVQMYNMPRDAWNYDEFGNYIKHALCQIETERSQAIAARYDRDGYIAPGTLVDPWKPLKDLTHSLLPHLSFARIDVSNRNQIQCLWRVHTSETFVDIDDLSSGEKSIIQMFYPLIEHEVKALLNEITTGESETTRPEICVLIDEPELHLHPNLQMKVMDYLRLITYEGTTQAIIATHSPTMVENATFEELFLLRPAELLSQGDNQLTQVATNEERLNFLHNVFGTVPNITALQPVIVVEGTDEQRADKVVPDRKLYRALHSAFDGVTLIAGGGKSECRALLTSLEEALKSLSPQLRVIALLDRDTQLASDDDRVHLLPVSMVENFLTDPDSIWEALQSVIEKTSFQTVDDIEAALNTVLDNQEKAEIGRRVTRELGLAYFRPTLPIDQIGSQAASFAQDIQTRYAEAKVQVVLVAAKKKVDELREKKRRREEFDGKAVLSNFYKEHLHRSGLPKVVFTFETARHARRRRAVIDYFDAFFKTLENAEVK